MAALNQQLAISLAFINILSYCVYGSSGTGGESRCYMLPLTREHKQKHSGDILVAGSIHT